MSLLIERREKVGPVIGVRLPATLHQEVAELAAQHGATAAEVVRALVRDALAVKSPAKAPAKPAAHKAPKPSGREAVTPEVIAEIAARYSVDASAVARVWDSLTSWCDANGKRYADWRAALMNWVRRDLELGKISKSAFREFAEPEGEALKDRSAEVEAIRRNLADKLAVS